MGEIGGAHGYIDAPRVDRTVGKDLRVPMIIRYLVIRVCSLDKAISLVRAL